MQLSVSCTAHDGPSAPVPLLQVQAFSKQSSPTDLYPVSQDPHFSERWMAQDDPETGVPPAQRHSFAAQLPLTSRNPASHEPQMLASWEVHWGPPTEVPSSQAHTLAAQAAPAARNPSPHEAQMLAPSDVHAVPVAGVPFSHTQVAVDAKPGWEMPVVLEGFVPGVHTQDGSPSSSPLVMPSPSLSAWQSAVLHWLPPCKNASPNGLRLPPPPLLMLWPTPPQTAPLCITLPPFGILALNEL